MSQMSSMSGSRSRAATPLQPTQIIALAVGAIYTIIGIVGFAITGFDNFALATSEDDLLGFQINPLHNVVHLALGVAGLAMWQTHRLARNYGWLLAAGYGAAFIYGLFTVNSSSGANFLALNTADNGLHLATAIIGVATALMPTTATADTRSSQQAPQS